MEIAKDVAAGFLKVIQETGNFVLEQAPDVIQQTLIFSFWSNILYLIISIIVLIFGVTFLKFACKMPNEKYDGCSPTPQKGFAFAGSVILILFGFFHTVHFTEQSLEIKLAPKLFLIEKFSRIVSHGQ